MTPKKRIVLVEDYEEMLLVYRALFRGNDELEFVAQYLTAESMLRNLNNLRPDLIIMDISLPGMDGIELARKVSKEYPAVKILMVTGHEKERFYQQAKRAGAHDLITKGDTRGLKEAVTRLLETVSK